MVGGKVLPPTIQTSVKFRDFAEQCLSLVSDVSLEMILCKFTNFKAHFPLGSVDGYSLTDPCQKLKKKTWKGLFLSNYCI